MARRVPDELEDLHPRWSATESPCDGITKRAAISAQLALERLDSSALVPATSLVRHTGADV